MTEIFISELELVKSFIYNKQNHLFLIVFGFTICGLECDVTFVADSNWFCKVQTSYLNFLGGAVCTKHETTVSAMVTLR